jgi:hypothetical protein
MSSNDMINRQLENFCMKVSPMASIGMPRAVSDDEMTEYPAVKRRRDSDASKNERAMEVEMFPPISESLPSQDDVLIEVCATYLL